MMHAQPVAEIVGGIVTLLLVGSAILAVSKRFRLPFTVALLVAGIAISWLASIFPGPLRGLQHLRVSPELIFYIFLPTLVFEASFHLDARLLRRNLGAILTLAVPGLLLSTLLVGLIVAWATSIPFPAALLLGAILSATDPVAVIALFKEVGAPQRLAVLVEGESLFNDATAVVVSRILLGVVLAGVLSVGTVGTAVVDFVSLFAGGLAVGLLLGIGVGYLLGQVESDPYIEITLTTVLAYCSFLIAEEVFGVSGIMATIGAGLVIGNWGRLKISVSVRDYLSRFWEYMAFVANALIFLMVGLRVDLAALYGVIHLLPWVILAILVARAAVVYGLLPLMDRFHWQGRVDLRYRTIMFWGGLRGAIALALALGLPTFEYTETFVALVMGVVLFTLLVQATSVRYLIGLFGLDRVPLADRLAHLDALIISRTQALERIDQLEKGGLFSDRIAGELRQECRSDIERTQSQMEALHGSELDLQHEHQLLYLRALALERTLLENLFNQGHLSEQAFRELLLLLTLESEAIRDRGQMPEVQLRQFRRQKWMRGLVDGLRRLPGLSGIAERWRMARVARDYEEAWARYQGSGWVLENLAASAQAANICSDVESEVRQQYEMWQTTARQQLDQTAEQFPEFVSAMQQRMGQRMLLLAEAESTARQAELGLLPAGSAAGQMDEIAHRLRRLRGQEISGLKIEPAELLGKLPFLRQIPADQFTQLAARMQAHTLTRDQVVIQQGDTGKSMYFIARGVLRVVHEDAAGTLDLGTMLAGDFFGEIALLHDVRRTATVKAVTPGLVYELSRHDMAEVMTAYPAIRAALEDADRSRVKGR